MTTPHAGVSAAGLSLASAPTLASVKHRFNRWAEEVDQRTLAARSTPGRIASVGACAIIGGIAAAWMLRRGSVGGRRSAGIIALGGRAIGAAWRMRGLFFLARYLMLAFKRSHSETLGR